VSAPEPTRDLVMIHGAWQGSWAWAGVIPILEAMGFRCHAVDMPGNGADATKPKDVSMAMYMAYLRGLLDGIDAPVIVLGHSSGGIIASQLGELEAPRVHGIIYIAGMMLPSGMKFAELVADISKKDPAALGIVPHLAWSGDGATSTVKAGAARNIFYQDCSAAKASWAAKQLKPHPERGRDIAARLTKGRFGKIPRAYIEARRDQSVLHKMQRRMQKLVPGARRYGIDTGHAPQLANPDGLAKIIGQAIAGILD
jgi:pimeloyl-ACP methyl ester carboxylesterase